MAAYDRGEYYAAALAFEEAYRRSPRGAAIYNAGRAWERAKDRARAADAFAAALASQDFLGRDAAIARERLAALEPGLATIAVRGPPAATVALDGAERGELPRVLHVTPGQHEVRATRRDGTVAVRSVSVAAEEAVTVAVDDAPEPPRPDPVARAANATASPPTPARDGPAADSTRMPTWGWLTLGGAGVLGVTYAVLYFGVVVPDKSAYQAKESDPASKFADRSAAHDRWQTDMTATIAVGAAAGVCAVLAGVAFFALRDRGPASRPSVTLRLSPVSVSAAATF
jgi:hypothetical protein